MHHPESAVHDFKSHGLSHDILSFYRSMALRQAVARKRLIHSTAFTVGPTVVLHVATVQRGEGGNVLVDL